MEYQQDDSMKRTLLDIAGFKDGGSSHSQGIQASPLGARKDKKTDFKASRGTALLTPGHSPIRLILDF